MHGRSRFTLLLLRSRRDNNDVALSGFLVRASSYQCARVTVVCRIAEVLHLGIADFFFGIYEEDLACHWVLEECVGDG